MPSFKDNVDVQGAASISGSVEETTQVLKLASGQTQPFIEFEDDTGTVLSTIGIDGKATGALAGQFDAAGAGATAQTNAENYTNSQLASYAPKASPTFTGITTAPEFTASGLTGATAASRYVGATASGAPTSGTFAVGDFVIDHTAAIWVCTTAGSPGTWTKVGGSGGAAWGIGTAAARPSAASFGSGIYFATDSGEVTFSDGTAWHAIAQTSNSTFAAGDTGTSTYTQIGPSGPAGSGQALYLRSANQYFGYRSNFALEYGGNLGVSTAGNGLRVAEGSNAKQGVATLVAGAVTVANTSVTSTSRIMLTPQDGNTVGSVRVDSRVAGTSFTIKSSNSADTGVVAFEIFEVG